MDGYPYSDDLYQLEKYRGSIIGERDALIRQKEEVDSLINVLTRRIVQLADKIGEQKLREESPAGAGAAPEPV